MFEKYYDSPAYGELCKRTYGKNLSQLGMVTMNELEILYREAILPSDSHILDMGCGSGDMSAEIAGHYKAQLTGIDADEGSILCAQNKFPAYNFILGDGSSFPFESSAFNLICFCDSLHFTRTTENLRNLLDKCLIMLKPNGKLAIFWSKNMMFDKAFQESTANHTQVGLWGEDNNIPFKAVDLTDMNRNFWSIFAKELLAMETELRREIPETYERLKDECTSYVNGDNNKLNISVDGYRWLYIFTPN